MPDGGRIMSFRVSARTILQLGAELISSDGVAFYELVKNAFDAGSRKVEIDVVVRLPHPVIEDAVFELQEILQDGDKADAAVALEKYQDVVLGEIDMQAPSAKDLRKEVLSVGTVEELIEALRRANYIEISDQGSGMSMRDLTDIYLTIGTAHRARERTASVAAGHLKRILGEKGIGRLSTMRLGNMLLVRTAREADSHWNELEVDWEEFATADDSKLVGDIHVAPRKGARKSSTDKGTRIRIADLAAAWDENRLIAIAQEEFSKFTDPFTPSRRFPIVAKFNGLRVSVPHFESVLFDHAHAVIEVDFVVGPRYQPELHTRIEYTPPGARHPRKRDFSLSGVHLYSASGGAREHLLRSLGPWKMTARWYNRRLLTRIEGIGELKQVRELVRRWAGGVMVFRDGFRVQPYGGPEDDWLGLDRRALGAGGFKVNRNQIIGKVDLSAIDNPNLVDQTNREGLRKNREQETFAELLRTVFLGQFKAFLDEVDKEVKTLNAPTLGDVLERLSRQDTDLSTAVQELVEAAPGLRQHPAMRALREAVDSLRELVEDTNRVAQSYDRGQGQLVNLAGIGLTVEILAHELTRATTGALRVLADARASDSVKDVFEPLQLQLETLSKRLRVLDPLSTAGRQHKTTFDLNAWVRTIMGYHDAQFRRHGIRHRFEVVPNGAREEVKVHMVKGMVVQVLENLLSNSVYWLKVRKDYGDSFEPKIHVTLDTERREIQVWDNGPGIDPSRAETIFVPFNSTKPVNRGKGLGLYVSREIAQYNGGALFLDPEPDARDGMLRTFIFQLPEPKDA